MLDLAFKLVVVAAGTACLVVAALIESGALTLPWRRGKQG